MRSAIRRMQNRHSALIQGSRTVLRRTTERMRLGCMLPRHPYPVPLVIEPGGKASLRHTVVELGCSDALIPRYNALVVRVNRLQTVVLGYFMPIPLREWASYRLPTARAVRSRDVYRPRSFPVSDSQVLTSAVSPLWVRFRSRVTILEGNLPLGSKDLPWDLLPMVPNPLLVITGVKFRISRIFADTVPGCGSSFRIGSATRYSPPL